MAEHYFGATDKGRVRDNNEDTFLVEGVAGGASVLACVIDGVGGYEGGEVAAATARDSIAEYLRASPASGPEGLREALLLANQRIIEQKGAHRGGERMACVLTLALADLATNQAHYAHVGDTRMYLLRGSSLVKVTKDHSFVGFLEDSSRITEQNAMRHPKRNEVNKALGFDPTIGKQADYIETGSSPFLPGDLLLLCSDGLTDMIGSREIGDVLTGTGSIADKAKALLDAANSAGGRDNITVVLVQNNKARVAQEPMASVARKAEMPSSVVSAMATASVSETETPSKNPVAAPRSSSPAVWLLMIVCLALAGALAWALMREKQPKQDAKLAAASDRSASVQKSSRNTQEKWLVESIDTSTGALILDSSSSNTPIVITDSILIRNETLHINGGGLILRGDAGMHSPAFVISDSARFVFLENMVFENFLVAIRARDGVLQLQNVRFRNCGTSVSLNLHPHDGVSVTGFVNGAALYRSDSSITVQALNP